MLGANPHASQGSLLAAADVIGRLDGIRARGGRVVVVDPRRTGTAEHADESLPIRPGTDAALLLAIAQVLFVEDRVRLGRLDGRVNGLDGTLASWLVDVLNVLTGNLDREGGAMFSKPIA